MATEIIMPKAGMDMEEGTVIKWLKAVGDKIEVGDPVLEILTDKVNMEVEAEVSGTLLSINAQEGDVLPVFTVIGYIGQAGEAVPSAGSAAPAQAAAPAAAEAAPAQAAAPAAVVQEEVLETGKVRATPAARKLAKEKTVSLFQVKGTGPKGRVQLADVDSFNPLKATPLAAKIAQVENIDLAVVTGTGVGGKITKEDLQMGKEAGVEVKPAAAVAAPKAAPAPSAAKGKIIPMVGMRKIIAERMKDSVEKTATVSINIEVDMTETIALRNRLKDLILKETEQKITFTDIIIMAVTKGLVKYPVVNSTLTAEGILINDAVNMGLAVGLDNGLMVPVIKGTDKMTLKEIVAGRSDIVKRTVGSKIKPDELQGSTFTISNLGMFDTVSFTSIINQPNSAILSVGAILERVRVINKEPVVRSVMNMTITLDHRVMDGVVGAKFLQYTKALLEDPTLMLM